MAPSFATTCVKCGSVVDETLLGGACPRCLLDDAMNGLQETKAENFDGHELLGEIARGGMGVVYRARQLDPERLVALKTLRSASLDSPEAMARFKHEAEVMVALDHAAILPVYHCGEMDGIPFFTMKLVEGGTLAERIGSFSGRWREIAKLMVTVCDGVRHAHERGVLHRDLKPGNILFDKGGQPYVSDFGIAKLADSQNVGLTVTLSVIGTPHYLAPEIAAGSVKEASVSSDVWSLGVILFELLTGRRPFEGESVTMLLRALDTTEAPPVSTWRRDVPRDLAVITSKALQKVPSRRYASARELAEDLRAWLDGRPITARAVPAHERAWMWSRRNPKLAGTAALLVLAVLGAAAALVWGIVRVKQENTRVVASQAQTQQQLRVALLHQAHSGRVSKEMGWRKQGIEALRRAYAIAPGGDVRDELIGHLAGFDLVPGARSFTETVVPSLSLKYCLRTKGDTKAMAIARLDDMTNLFDLPDPYGSRLTFPIFATDDSWVAVATESGGVRVFSMGEGHRQLAHFPDMLLIGASSDRSLIHLGKSSRWQMIDTTTWQPVASGDLGSLTKSTEELVKKVPTFHNDPKLSLCAVSDGNEVRVVDWRTGEELRRVKSVRPPQSYRLTGPNLIIGCGDIGQGIDFMRDREVFFGPGFASPHYLMSAQGFTELLASSEYRQTGLWHFHSGQPLVKGNGLVVMTMAADGVHFFGRMPQSEVGRIERPTVMQFLPDSLLRGSLTAAFRSLAISPDGRMLALHDRAQIVIHDVESGKLIARKEANEAIALGFSPDGRTLLVVNSGGLEGWTLNCVEKQLTLTKALNVPAPQGRTFMNGRMLQDGERFLVSTQKLKPYCETYRLYRARLKWERQPAPDCPIAGLTDVTPDGVFNIGGQNQFNVINNIKQLRYIFLEPDKTGKALGAFSPDGRQLVMVDVTHHWKLYNEEAWLNPKVAKPRSDANSDSGSVTGAQIPAWARSGRWFAVSPDSKRVSLIDASTQQAHFTLESPVDVAIDIMLVSEDERTLVLQRRGGSVEVWHLDRLVKELHALGVECTLPPPPERKPTPPELVGPFAEAELPAWSPRNSAATP